jgi:hypothetical protein
MHLQALRCSRVARTERSVAARGKVRAAPASAFATASGLGAAREKEGAKRRRDVRRVKGCIFALVMVSFETGWNRSSRCDDVQYSAFHCLFISSSPSLPLSPHSLAAVFVFRIPPRFALVLLI